MLGGSFGSIIRDEDDVIKDISILNNICQEYKDIKNKYETLLALTNIESMTRCSCRDYTNKISFSARLNCDICNGIGYVITYKANKE